MKFFSAWQFLLLGISTTFVEAGVCDDCGLSCQWWDVTCNSRSLMCRSSGLLFRGLVTTLELGCQDSLSTSNADNDRVKEAFRTLMIRGFATPIRTNSIGVRICPLIGIGADGFATKPDRIYLDDTTRTYDDTDFAVLMAKQMKRAEQIERWGEGGFACRYSQALASGNGFGQGNPVEKEVMERGNEVRDCLISSRNCPNRAIETPVAESAESAESEAAAESEAESPGGGVFFQPPPPPPALEFPPLPPPTSEFPPLPAPQSESSPVPGRSTCGSCPFSNHSCCGNQCINVENTWNHCGRCGNQCGFGKVCRHGLCLKQDSTWIP